MTKQLTKNDSMCDSKQDFDTIVAAFEAFLNNNQAHKSYFKEWASKRGFGDTSILFQAWRVWAKCIDHRSWIICAFGWRTSQEKFSYWCEINRMWTTWLNQNLKK